jgi:cell division septum initiation protein DivIVA
MKIEQILLDEIRQNRAEIKEIKKELAVFKIKAFTFMAVVSMALNLTINKFLP